MRSLVAQSVKGQAAEFLARVISETPDITWHALKARLMEQYNDQGDREIAVQRLQKLKQHPGETIQCFSERIRRTAMDAYPGKNLNDDILSKVCVNTLVDGCLNDRIAQKLIRSRPDGFDAAITMAIREQQTHRLFEMRRKEEPMEVDAVTAAKNSKPAADTAVLEKLVARLEALEHRQQPKPSRPSYQKPKPNFKWTDDGRPVCSFCSKIGHKWRECRQRRSQGHSRNTTQTKN